MVFVLAVDVYGSTDRHDSFRRCDRMCKYSKNCPLRRGMIVDALKRGEVVDLGEIAGEKGEGGFWEQI